MLRLKPRALFSQSTLPDRRSGQLVLAQELSASAPEALEVTLCQGLR